MGGNNTKTTKLKPDRKAIFDIQVHLPQLQEIDLKSFGELGKIPKDILLLCLSYLSYKDLCSVNRVSKGLHEESNNPILWKKFLPFYLKGRRFFVKSSLDVFSHPKAKFAFQFQAFPQVYNAYYTLLTIVITGASNTGKSALLAKMCANEFMENYEPTIGVTFNITRVIDYDRKTSFGMQIWDISGNPKFDSMRQVYSRGSQLGIFVFSITNRESFEVAKSHCIGYKSQILQPKIILVGNQVDRDRDVSFEEAFHFSLQIEAKYIKKKKKTDQGIQKLAEDIINFFP